MTVDMVEVGMNAIGLGALMAFGILIAGFVLWKLHGMFRWLRS